MHHQRERAGTARTDPPSPLSQRTVKALYAGRDASPEKKEWRRNLWKVLVNDFFARHLHPGGEVLDYGCGRGEFINAVNASRRIAVDLRDGVRKHLEHGIVFVRSDDDWVSKVGEKTVSNVFCSNLLEHLPDRDTVLKLFQDFHRVLRPDGRLLVLGPNLHYTGPAYWDFFDHVLPLTHVSLAEALRLGGFETELLIPRFLPYTAVGARPTPLILVRWYLRLPFAWRFWGAQFFAVARPRTEAGSQNSGGEGQ